MNQFARSQNGSAVGTTWRGIARWGGLLGGTGLAIFGLTRRSPWGLGIAAGGGALAFAGSKLDYTPRVLEARSSVLVNCSANEAYRFWRDFENLPRFMSRVENVNVSGDGRVTWTVVGAGSRMTWDTYIVNVRENERIDFSSTPGSPVGVEGSVEFRPAPANRGTIVEAAMAYRGSTLGLRRSVAQFIGKFPSFLMRQDLRRFKALVETGEIPTIEGQSHGPRSMTAALARLADPTRRLPSKVPGPKLLSALRRIA